MKDYDLEIIKYNIKQLKKGDFYSPIGVNLVVGVYENTYLISTNYAENFWTVGNFDELITYIKEHV